VNKPEFIRHQLSQVPGVEIGAEQATMLCPFHDDTNPSLDVALVPIQKGRKGVAVGGFNCWGCKTHGGWNKLAQKLGLEEWRTEHQEEYEDRPQDGFYDLARTLEGLSEATKDYEKPPTDGPWEGPWRGLTGEFLRSVGAESLWDKYAEEYRVYFPIKDAFGKLVGHVAARGDNSKIDNKKKYMNSTGFDATKYWFGLHLEQEPKVVVIVEGPYDMLRFRSRGIPAIAVLGINTLTDEKVLQIIAKGCNTVILALDADDAGRGATPEFCHLLQRQGLRVFDLNLSRYLKDPKAKMDPGDCPDPVIEDLKNFVQTLRTS